MRAFNPIILILWGFLGAISSVHAAFIERTITVDGDMSDWYDTGSIPPIDITINANQFSEDAEDGSGFDLDEPLSNTGRDLKKFSFTWDTTNLYFYVERFASESNVTDWWFFIDSTTDGVAGTEPDGFMQDGETVLRIKWQGANRNTVAEVWEYVADDSVNGDPLTSGGLGDGYDMPGDIDNGTQLYNVDGGASTGTEMESRIPWTSILGLTGKANLKFHISSSNGTNLPNNIVDNMDGPAGGQLFPVDLAVTKVASVNSIRGLQSFTYTISVYNSSIEPITNVNITDNLPAQVTYTDPNYVASNGAYSSGVWNIPSIASNTTETLTITVTANVLPVSMNVDNTATLNTTTDPPTPADEDSSNDSSTATVTIIPIPQLTIVKNTGGVSNADPGTVLTYTLTITNTGGEDGEMVEITDQISPYERLKVDFGSGHPFIFNPGTSGLTLGTRTYSTNYGLDLYAHPLATDPPNTYDDQVTNFKIQFNGSMVNTSGSFTIQYQTQIR
jgi:uncharacterized repeat protein (TIGR01451 family)